jgi:hypothetical protein
MISITPNFFAYLALASWPLVALIFYRTKSLVSATLWTILAGQLFLPVGAFFKIDIIPPLDKDSIPIFCALAGCMISTGRILRLWNHFGFTEVLLCIYVLSPLITAVINGDPIQIGTTVLPGVGIYDGASTMLIQFITLIPFLLGRQFVRTGNDAYQILRVIAAAGLGYSILLLFEIRFSPQLHFWLYGFVPSDFMQEIREGGGFRPMAFMGHGLNAAFFTMTVVISTAALWRMRKGVLGMKASGGLTFYMGAVLYLSKSGAALVYALVLAPLVRWATPKIQIRVAVLLASLALLYPLLRITQIFPTEALVTISSNFSEDRASSLKFRFDQEDDLLQHAWERPWFGWGRYGRNRVLKENWAGNGFDSSITDGRWIITFGQFGVLGFFSEFGLLTISIFHIARSLRYSSSLSERILLGTIALILAANTIDLLPNSALAPWTWLLAGSLLGNSERLSALRGVVEQRSSATYANKMQRPKIT